MVDAISLIDLFRSFFHWWSSDAGTEYRFLFIIVNALLVAVNLLIIAMVIFSIRKFRKRVSIQDQSRLAYLEEFKGYIHQMFIKMDNATEQLNRIEDRQRGHKCGSD